MLSTAFSYSTYANGKEEQTAFGRKNSLTLPSQANKIFNGLRDENVEPISTYSDPILRHFVRQTIKSGRCVALNQFCKSIVPDEMFNIIAKELDVNGNTCEILEKFSD